MQQTIDWLRGLAEKGGKGVVNNIDARCLGRIADKLEKQRAALVEINSQAVCVAIARDGECFDMLENCARISEDALK